MQLQPPPEFVFLLQLKWAFSVPRCSFNFFPSRQWRRWSPTVRLYKGIQFKLMLTLSPLELHVMVQSRKMNGSPYWRKLSLKMESETAARTLVTALFAFLPWFDFRRNGLLFPFQVVAIVMKFRYHRHRRITAACKRGELAKQYMASSLGESD